jgi:NADH-quinone oxidoreductase subunit J
LLLAGGLLIEMLVALLAWNEGGIAIARHGAPPPNMSNIQALGGLLYTRYIFIFEAAGIVLLVAMIGAIVLTNRRRSDLRPQNVRRQIARRPQDATVLTQPTVGQGVEI